VDRLKLKRNVTWRCQFSRVNLKLKISCQYWIIWSHNWKKISQPETLFLMQGRKRFWRCLKTMHHRKVISLLGGKLQKEETSKCNDSFILVKLLITFIHSQNVVFVIVEKFVATRSEFEECYLPVVTFCGSHGFGWIIRENITSFRRYDQTRNLSTCNAKMNMSSFVECVQRLHTE
jgi:hypothetical protein